MNRSLQFHQLLQNASTFLEQYAEDAWSSILSDYARRARAGEDVKSKVHGLFGGMGSFNDLYITPINGHRLGNDQIDDVNRRLNELRDLIWHAVRRSPKA